MGESKLEVMVFLAVIVATVLTNLLGGYVLFKYWNWFLTIEPIGIGSIGYLHLMGILFFVELIRSGTIKEKIVKILDVIKLLLTKIIFYSVFLLLGKLIAYNM